MKRSLGLFLALTLIGGVAPIGGANAATPKVGSKCTKANQKIKVSKQSYLCAKSGKKLVWVKVKPTKTQSKKSASPAPSQSPSPAGKTDSTQSKTAESAAPVISAEKKTNAPSPAPTKTSTATKTPSPSPAPATSSGDSSSGLSAPATAPAPAPEAPAPEASPSPSASSSSAPISNVIETKPVSLNSPKITGIKNGDIPKNGQALSCSGWKWDQVVAQTIVSWIAYPSNTGSDIIDPALYMTLSEGVALTESKFEISAAHIEKVSGNYLYCFAKGMTAGGLETTSIAAILLGK